MEWMQDNAELLSALGTAIMAIAWIFYAQFAIFTYLSQRRPRIIIDQTADHSINTRFVIVNLGESPVYISGIMVVVRRGDEETIHKIANYHRSTTDDDDGASEDIQSMEDELRHGTLGAGQLFLMGNSNQTLSWLLEDGAGDVDEPRLTRLRSALEGVDDFEFRVVAMPGTDDKPIASSRGFEIEYEDDELRIVPTESATRHYTSWRDRSVAFEWSEQLRRQHY